MPVAPGVAWSWRPDAIRAYPSRIWMGKKDSSWSGGEAIRQRSAASKAHCAGPGSPTMPWQHTITWLLAWVSLGRCTRCASCSPISRPQNIWLLRSARLCLSNCQNRKHKKAERIFHRVGLAEYAVIRNAIFPRLLYKSGRGMTPLSAICCELAFSKTGFCCALWVRFPDRESFMSAPTRKRQRGRSSAKSPKARRPSKHDLADFIGLDVCVNILDVLYTGFGDSKYRACPLLRKMVAVGWLGRKSGREFYIYTG